MSANGTNDRPQEQARELQRDLVERAARGDQEAFEALVRTSANRLFAIAYRILRELLPDDADTSRAPDDIGSGADRDQIERGFRRLKPDQRAILTLHHVAGLSSPEIADVLGIPVGTAGSRLHYATQAFRAALDADERLEQTRERSA